VFSEDGTLVGVTQWPAEVAVAIAGCDVVTKRKKVTKSTEAHTCASCGKPADTETEVVVEDQEFIRRVRIEPKRPALELLAKMLGVIKPHGSADESEDIDLDNLTNEELKQWDTLVRKALGTRATQLLSNLEDDPRGKPGKPTRRDRGRAARCMPTGSASS
jgi:hypothetical protein